MGCRRHSLIVEDGVLNHAVETICGEIDGVKRILSKISDDVVHKCVAVVIDYESVRN